MISINIKGGSVKTLQQAYLKTIALWVGICTICQTPYQRHTSYLRKTPYILGPFTIQRVYCKNCRRTHALLPCFIIPYARVRDVVREVAIKSICDKSATIEELAELLDVDPRTIACWWQVFCKKSDGMLQALSAELAQTSQLADWASGNLADCRVKGLKILELIGRCRATFSPKFMYCHFAWLNILNPYLFCK